MQFSQLARLLLTGILLVIAGSALAGDEAIPRIVATGEGTASVAPDMAVLSLTVNREAASAREALDANSAAMEEVFATLQEEGIPTQDMQTSGFSIQPRYVYPKPRGEEPPRIVGYTVRNSLSIKVRDLARLGALLDRSVSLGVNEGGNVRFTNDDPSAVLSRAREAAVRDALGRVQTIARAAGVAVGRILEITERQNVSGPRPMMEAVSMARAADSVPLAAGENTYSVSVTVSVAIAQ